MLRHLRASHFAAGLATWTLLSLLMLGCQVTPTKVAESHQREFEVLVDKSQRPLVLDDKMVILDVRKSFDYGLNRVNNSLHFPWENLAENAETGEVIRDQRKAALRLSLHGLDPGTPVVILGNGQGGKGEEGRLAWTLIYLGFQDVQVGSIEMFRKNLTQNPTPPAKNVPIFKINERPSLQIGLDEFKQLAFDPKGRLQNRIFILDVRSNGEYFNQTKSVASAPDINALHIEWNEFYTPKGRPNPALKSKLEAMGVQTGDRVIVISNKGVRSGAAAYALMALGYKRVQNFTAGWNALLKTL